jgi:hypothetical protein
MPESAAIAGALLTSGALMSLVWGRALWYLDERSDVFRRAVYMAMGLSRRSHSEMRALMLAAAYYGLGLLAAISMAVAFDLPLARHVALTSSHGAAAVLGAIGEISLASLFVDLLRRITHATPERFAEIDEIPWIVGIQQLPPGMAPVAAAMGGMVEELVYRGVVLLILTEQLNVAPSAAVLAAGALFCLQQLLQVRTTFQAMVVGSACVAISVVGGLLVVATSSVVPAIVSHASFVVFFLRRGEGQRRPSRRVGGIAAR